MVVVFVLVCEAMAVTGDVRGRTADVAARTPKGRGRDEALRAAALTVLADVDTSVRWSGSGDGKGRQGRSTGVGSK